jgi:phosphoglycolate phosphatase-like HAD superfamily hydrolase
MQYFIFDFDGVLCDSLQLSFKIVLELLIKGEVSIQEIKKQYYNYFQQSKSQNPSECHLQNTPENREFIEKVCKKLVEYKPKLFESFLEELSNRHNTGNYKMAIVSSSLDYYIIDSLGKKSDMFEFIFGFEVSSSKKNKIDLICESWKVKPNDCFYFTDTQGDIMELEGMLGIEQIIGCQWTWHNLSDLSKFLKKEKILRNKNDFLNFCLQLDLKSNYDRKELGFDK